MDRATGLMFARRPMGADLRAGHVTKSLSLSRRIKLTPLLITATY